MPCRAWTWLLATAALAGRVVGAAPTTQPTTTSAPASRPAEDIITLFRAEAAALRPLVKTPWVASFLDQAALLPRVTSRVVYRDEKTREWYSPQRRGELSESVRAGLREVSLDETYYYTTRYGTPLAYARAFDVLGEAGLTTVEGSRILDYGYGTIGHLRMLAQIGVDAVGVDVDPLLELLYGSDQGPIVRGGGRSGRVTIVNGRWPASDAVRQAVGRGFDVMISKNTLKNGYVHPAKPVDQRMLLDLGVDEKTFVKAMFDVLEPEGLLLIYNICPAPAAPDKPYIPWADGRSPFTREQWRDAGFEIIKFDEKDDDAVRRQARALGWDKGGMDVEKDLFAWYTLLRRPAGT